MKILVISNLFPPDFIGGYELGALDLVEYLHKKGHEVRVLTGSLLQDDKNVLQHLDIQRSLRVLAEFVPETTTSTQLRDGVFYLPENIRTIYSHIINFQPEAILCFNLHGLGQLGLLVALEKCNIPVFIYFMDNLFGQAKFYEQEFYHFEEIFRKITLKTFTNIFLSYNLCNEVSLMLGMSSLDPHIIPNHHHLKIPKLLNESANSLKIIFSSRIASHKGVFILLDAIKKLRKIIPDMQLDIYGDGEVDSLNNVIAKYSLQDVVTFKGVVRKDKLQHLYSDYNIMVLPTWHREPGPYVMVEAAACGCLPVVSGGIGCAEYFIHEYDCIKCERNVESVAGALYKIYCMEKEILLQVRYNAQKTAFKYFTLENVGGQLESLLQKNMKKNTVSAKRLRSIEISLLTLFELWKEKV